MLSWKKKELIPASDMEISSEGVLKKYTGRDAVVEIPEGVVKIGLWAFLSNEWIKEVVVPSTVTEIDSGAFERSSLERIVLPDSVTAMDYNVFYCCRELAQVRLPDRLRRIPDQAFGFCKKLRELKLPAGLREIGRDAFANSGITELTIPDGMNYLGKNCCRYMGELERLILPSAMRSIGDGAFSFCGKLREVDIPEGVLEIESGAFDACTNLERVCLPKSLIKWNKRAFSRTKLAESGQLEEMLAAVGPGKTYPRPDGFGELNVCEVKLYYGAERQISGSVRATGAEPRLSGDVLDNGTEQLCGGLLEIDGEGVRLSGFCVERTVTEGKTVLEDEIGNRALCLCVQVPTFDAGDREWDSYRKLYLIPAGERMNGVLVCGGYRISKVTEYEDIRWADEVTERLVKGLWQE